MKVFKCRICQEGYLGDEPPTHCPFCGAHRPYIKEAAGFHIPEFTLTNISRHNLSRALDFEKQSAEFYFCAANRADNIHDYTMFNRLAKIESEHASVITTALKNPPVNIRRNLDVCSIENTANLAKSHDRESQAINDYTQYLGMATEERIIEIFSAFIKIESDHLSLTAGRF